MLIYDLNLNTEDQPATSGQEQPGQSTLRELDSDVLYSKVTGLKTLVVLPKWRGAMRFGPVQQVAEDRLEVSKLAAIDAKARLIRLSRNDGRRVAEFTLTRLQSLAQQTLARVRQRDRLRGGKPHSTDFMPNSPGKIPKTQRNCAPASMFCNLRQARCSLQSCAAYLIASQNYWKG